MTAWLSPKLDLAGDLLDEVFVMLEDAAATTHEKEVQNQKTALEEVALLKKREDLVIATRQADMDEEILRTQIAAMLDIVNNEERESSTDAIAVQAQLKEIEDLLENLIKSWNRAKSLCEKEELDAVFEKEDEARKFISESRSAANAFISKVIPSEKKSKPSTSESNAWKVEKVRLPTFGGNHRAYTSFKGDFKRIVVMNHPDKLY